MKSATCSLLAVLLFGAAAVAEEVAWNVESYNPQPLDGDLSLPMPCGGAMTFRRVDVASTGVLGDEPIRLGSHQTEHGYAEYVRKVWLAGAFDSEDRSGRHYFIGKYEVTAMQYAVFHEQCPDPDDPDLELPVTQVSWAESMLFAERYSEWLVNNARDLLPDREEAHGFMRLPTEAEWEFAARGGTNVSPSELDENTFFPSGKLNEYVVHDGNSYKRLGFIGALKPNPLGIHDILGNAAEMVLDPFRLDAVGRLHGQAGGFVLRGGSFRSRPSEIRTSHRIEYPPMDERGIRRQKTAGIRLALVAPALPSRQSITLVREAWEARQQQPARPVDDSGPQLPEEQEDPVKEARTLAKAAASPEMKRRLENLAAVIAVNVRARKEERERAAQESLGNAVFAAHRVVTDIGLLDRWCGLVRLANDSNRVKRQKKFDENHKIYDSNLRYYLDKLKVTGGDYGEVELLSEADRLRIKYKARGLEHLLRLMNLVLKHADRIRHSGPSAAKPGIVRTLFEKASDEKVDDKKKPIEKIKIEGGDLQC